MLFPPWRPTSMRGLLFSQKEKSKHPLLMPSHKHLHYEPRVPPENHGSESENHRGLVLAPEGRAAWSVPSLQARTTANKQILDWNHFNYQSYTPEIQIFKLNKFSVNTFPALSTMLRAGHEESILSLFRLLLENTMTGRLRHNTSVLLAVLVAGSLGSGCQPGEVRALFQVGDF